MLNGKSIALLEIKILERFHMIWKLSQARLDKEDRKIGTEVFACSELVCTIKRRMLPVGNDVKQ